MSGETYFLTADISTSSSDCITIAAGGINLQCQGHIISGPSPGSSFRGIFASGKTGITINNCKVINFGYGIRFEGSSNNILTNNNVSSNSYGIYLYQSNSNQLSSNMMQSNSQGGITLETSNNNKILNSQQISNNPYGIYLMNGASNNNITKNNLTNNNYGIYIIAGSQFNYIYDNFFNNTNNAFSQGLMNYWNVTIGGNYWDDYTGNDTSIPPDGIGDNKLPYNSSGNITNRGDYLPLVRLDTTPPQYSNIKEPIDPSVYNPSATYNFNINWTDNVAVDDIILEMDWVNYSYKSGQLTKVGDIYSLTFSTCTYGGGKGGGTGRPLMMSMDPITPVIEIIKLLLNGGVVEAQSSPCLITSTHYYRWYAKDTSGNWNSTGMMTFTIYNEDPIVVDIISPENRTYSSNTVDIKYTVSSPFEISWIGYSLDKKPNVTLTGNTTINVNEAVHNIIFYGNTTYGVTNSSQKIYFTVALPKTSTTSIRTTTTTRQTTTIISCTCTAWKATYICCTGGKGKWTRTCTPKACQAESKCEGPCAV